MKENSIIKIDCKYYLPCGRCDKTNGLCSMLEESNIVISTKKSTEYSVHPSFYVPVDNGGVTPV